MKFSFPTLTLAALLFVPLVCGQGANAEKDPMPVVALKLGKANPAVEQPPSLTTPVDIWVRFPLILRRAGIESGKVTARMVIEPNGTVSRVTLLTSSQHEFAESVWRGAKKCVFAPARIGGRAARCEIEAEFTFRME